MQRILSYMRRAVSEFGLIKDGDRIAVGVSGGKDSLVLLVGLVLLRRFIGIEYDVVALTLDPFFDNRPGNYKPVFDLCEQLDVPYVLKETQIGPIIFDIRKEKNPCSLCARMRRGALHDLAKEHGCNKIALGHHYDDAVETFIMNLFNEGRIDCFSPMSYLSRKDLYLIRPLAFAPEVQVASAAKKNNLPIVKSKCPVDKTTSRQKTKDFLRQMEKESDGFKFRIFGAMRRADVAGWRGMDMDMDEFEQNDEYAKE